MGWSGQMDFSGCGVKSEIEAADCVRKRNKSIGLKFQTKAVQIPYFDS